MTDLEIDGSHFQWIEKQGTDWLQGNHIADLCWFSHDVAHVLVELILLLFPV